MVAGERRKTNIWRKEGYRQDINPGDLQVVPMHLWSEWSHLGNSSVSGGGKGGG